MKVPFGLRIAGRAATPAPQTSTSAQTATPDQTNGRALPSPLNSPPFPSADWLGFPIIGEPNDQTVYPLQRALFGHSLDASRIRVYGWIDPSVNYSTSRDSNYPVSYDIVPNKIELDQFLTIVERWPDTVQRDHTDWGFRVENLYGLDYRFTIMQGVFSNQLLQHNHLYGDDPVEFYGILYFPKVAEGMVVRIGRYISVPDIEAQLAPGNYMFTHSVMFTIDPYTMMGINAMIRLSPYWSVMAAVHAGNDTAIWSRSASLNGTLMARWVSKDNNDSIWGGINSIGNGHYRDGHDDLQQIIATWGHKFNDRVHMMTEAYYMWMFDGALAGNAVGGGFESFGAGGGQGPIIPGLSYQEGLVNYFQVEVGKKRTDYLSLRTDYFNDPTGQRYGFRGAITSETLGWTHFFSPLVIARPEIRYDYAWNSTPYDDGRRRQQLSIAADLVVRF